MRCLAERVAAGGRTWAGRSQALLSTYMGARARRRVGLNAKNGCGKRAGPRARVMLVSARSRLARRPLRARLGTRAQAGDCARTRDGASTDAPNEIISDADASANAKGAQIYLTANMAVGPGAGVGIKGTGTIRSIVCQTFTPTAAVL